MIIKDDYEFISIETSPHEMLGKHFKFNETIYCIKKFLGYGEHRFIFSLENIKDKTKLLNLLVLRQPGSREKILQELDGKSEHKKRKTYFQENINLAIRETKEAYYLDKNIDETTYELFINERYSDIVARLINKSHNTSYEFFMISLCYTLLGEIELSAQYLEFAKNIDCNFDFSNLREYFLSHIDEKKQSV